MSSKTEKISIVIPTLNEEETIGTTLDAIRPASDIEIIIADGGSSDRTCEIAARFPAVTIIQSAAGRGRQMNMGAAAATGDILLFLHADTLLPPCFAAQIPIALTDPATAAGAFSLAIDGPGIPLRIIERLANHRARKRQTPYGDQALFLRRDTFNKLGGYRDIPLLEDLVLVLALRRLGRIAILPDTVLTSGRRWLSNGPLRITLLNQLILLAFRCGVAPRHLAGLYGIFRRQ